MSDRNLLPPPDPQPYPKPFPPFPTPVPTPPPDPPVPPAPPPSPVPPRSAALPPKLPPKLPPAQPPPPALQKDCGFELISVSCINTNGECDDWYNGKENADSSNTDDIIIKVPTDFFQKDLVSFAFTYGTRTKRTELNVEYKCYCNKKVLRRKTVSLPNLSRGQSSTWDVVIEKPENTITKDATIPQNHNKITFEFREGDKVLLRVLVSARKRLKPDIIPGKYAEK